MKTYTVNVNGRPFKTFDKEADARSYMLYLVNWQDGFRKQTEYIEEAVAKSDMKEAKEVLKYIMEKK